MLFIVLYICICPNADCPQSSHVNMYIYWLGDGPLDRPHCITRALCPLSSAFTLRVCALTLTLTLTLTGLPGLGRVRVGVGARRVGRLRVAVLNELLEGGLVVGSALQRLNTLR